MATVYFFNGTQSGTADGSYADPYDLSSLATQESASSSGDVFIFKDGTYTLTSLQEFNGGAGITYKAENAGEAIFSGQTLRFGSTTGGSVNFTVEDINFIELNFSSTAVEVKMLNTYKVTLNRCVFKCDGTSTSGTAGFFGYTALQTTAYGTRATANECVFKAETTGSGAELFRNRDATFNSLLELDNCTCSHSVGGASIIFQNLKTGFVKNTIIYGASSNLTKGITTGLTETYNCYYNIGESADSANNIIVDDPQFVDSANGDFRLRPSSPCINAGTAS
jgi:hypothetical protein